MSENFRSTAKYILECIDDCAYTRQDKMVVANILFKYISQNNIIFDLHESKKFMYVVYEKIHEFEYIKNYDDSLDNRTYKKFTTTLATCKNIIETRLRKEEHIDGTILECNLTFPNVIKFFKKYEEDMEKERLEKERLEKERPEKERLEKEKPKSTRVQSPYILFCQEKRPELRASYPNASFGEMGAMLHQMWSQLDDAGKEKYIDLACNERVKTISEPKNKRKHEGQEEKPDRYVGGYNLRRLERKDYSKML